jgi:hypothetical protein
MTGLLQDRVIARETAIDARKNRAMHRLEPASTIRSIGFSRKRRRRLQRSVTTAVPWYGPPAAIMTTRDRRFWANFGFGTAGAFGLYDGERPSSLFPSLP